jgi:uncharacterized membrane protein YtjA (UPF0391 family)
MIWHDKCVPARRALLPSAESNRSPTIHFFFAHNHEEITMLYWALVFLIVALVAGFFGFVGIAGTAYGMAKILFFIFLVLFIVSLLAGGLRRPLP